jgi:hypothetical protein
MNVPFYVGIVRWPVLMDIADKVQYQAIAFPFGNPQASAHHLLIERCGERWPQHNHGIDPRVIEAFRENVNVAECSVATFLKVPDHTVPFVRCDTRAQLCCWDTHCG